MLRPFVLVLAFVASGCAPSLTPPYWDYRVTPEAFGSAESEAAGVLEALREAATEAGWELAEADAANVVTTESRRIETGIFSRTDASLDLAPLNGRFVRVHVHAVRRNTVFASRTKQPYLSRGLRERALAHLTDALAARGLVALDAPRERDEEATD